MLEYPEAIIITVDDDIWYPQDLIEKLLYSYLRYPFAVSAMRARRIAFDQAGNIAPYIEWDQENKTVGLPSYCLLATGVGGILYPPHCMHRELFNIEAIKTLCLYADDLWLKVMQILNGTPVVIADTPFTLQYIDGTQENALWRSNITESRNDEQIARILGKYDNFPGEKDTVTQKIWLSSLLFEDSKSLISTQYYRKVNDELDSQKKEIDSLRRELDSQKKEIDSLRRELDSRKKEADRLRGDLESVHTSVSFRIGRGVTYLPRKLRGGVQCYRDHGAGYTFRRVLYHMGLWKDEETD